MTAINKLTNQELNQATCREVMRYYPQAVENLTWNPMGNQEHLWYMVRKMSFMGLYLDLSVGEDNYCAAFSIHGGNFVNAIAHENATRAICEAALIAVRMMRKRGVRTPQPQKPKIDEVEHILYRDGEKCDHAGCKNHISHPCEKCGRIGARGVVYKFTEMEL